MRWVRQASFQGCGRGDEGEELRLLGHEAFGFHNQWNVYIYLHTYTCLLYWNP